MEMTELELPVSKPVTLLRVAGLCGILSSVVALTSIWLAISYAPWFSWTGNHIVLRSDQETASMCLNRMKKFYVNWLIGGKAKQ